MESLKQQSRFAYICSSSTCPLYAYTENCTVCSSSKLQLSPARLHWLHVPRLGHGEEQINQLPRSLTGHYCITRGCPGNLLCPVSPMSPGTRSIVLGRGGSFLCPERRTGAELGPGHRRARGNKAEPSNGASSGERSPYVTMCPIYQILHTLNVFFNLYLQTICCIASL